LNKSLLMLSKIENRQFGNEENVDFNALTNNITEDFADLAEFKNISINTLFTGQLIYFMNRDLATTLISNLLKNAIVHTDSGGDIEIIIDTNTFTVTNSGNSTLDSKKIFSRFYRDLNKEQSTGLGLSIVQSIAAIYNLKAQYSFEGKHIFKIIFPES